MKTRAAVAWAANKPLTIETIDLDGPQAGEVLVEIMATGVCHTDAYTLDGFDSEGIFPSIGSWIQPASSSSICRNVTNPDRKSRRYGSYGAMGRPGNIRSNGRCGPTLRQAPKGW